MALASLDAFAGVNPARAAAFGRRHALAVDNAGTGREGSALDLAGPGHQPRIDPLPGAVVAPAVEIALHRRARRKLTRQGAPLTAGPQQVEDRVDNRAQVALARPPQPARGRQQRRNLRPLAKPGIACIAQLVTPIILPSGFSPHVVPPSLSANNTESQLTEITQLIFGQPLRMTVSYCCHTQIFVILRSALKGRVSKDGRRPAHNRSSNPARQSSRACARWILPLVVLGKAPGRNSAM
jgi:hypothetical protein